MALDPLGSVVTRRMQLLDYDTWWALRAASCRPRCVASQQRAWPRERVEIYGRVVTLARPNLPYGQSSHHGARYAHLVRHVWVAWRHGRIVGARARWWCGAAANSNTFRLMAEPSREVCPMCRFQIERAA